MAAYSSLLSLEKVINQVLDRDPFSISPLKKKQIISIEEYVICFLAFFENLPQKTKIFEATIRDAAAQAEDILETFSWETIESTHSCTKSISRSRRIEFENQLNKVIEEMESIAAVVAEIKNSIKIKDKHLGDPVGATSSSRAADTGQTNMVGFNEDLKEIKDKLCGWELQLQVLPIFGMGGIGKTTLARNAYNDELIIDHFLIRVWVTISQDYSERKILMDLLDSMKEFDPDWRKESVLKRSEQGNESHSKCDEPTNSEMALKVHRILTMRRFLIVMDDIWSTKVLDDVKHLFPNTSNGSRIMITTRLIEVATYSNSAILPHEMRLMDAEQSWNLLRQKVFSHEDRIPLEIERTGREIARSCGGLPLAIVVIAGLLSIVGTDLTSWEEIAKNIRSSLSVADGQIENILSLSYTHLPHRLRSCFLYMGVFPEDRTIKVTYLIMLWIAESFVKPVVSEEIEDTAEEYLEDLVNRSLIMVTKRKSNGKIKSCILHDMVRELCIKLCNEEKFLVNVKGSRAPELLESMKDLRRISISHSDLNSISIYSSKIRTIMYFQDELDSFRSSRLVRVVDLRSAQFHYLFPPDLFRQLFHLRYLALRGYWGISTVISHLQSLQTLVMTDADQKYLPYEIWNMPQLRHLIIYGGIYLPDTNATTSALENLKTLGFVENLPCSISTLKLIPNLRKLWLIYSPGYGELLFHNLVLLSRLEKLYLRLKGKCRNSGRPNLVVPISLKRLTLVGWGFRGPYVNIFCPFPNLEVLKLEDFDFKQRVWRTTDKEFPQLKFLLIENSNLWKWSTESSHFPRLKTLHIHSCRSLSEIPECIGEIPTLELIELKRCTRSLVKSAKRILEEARSYGDDAFQVRFIDCLGGEL